MKDSRDSVLGEAIALHKAGQWTKAVDRYRSLLVSNPLDADASHLLGVAMGQLGRPEEAVTYIRAALERQPGSALAHVNLGNALFALRRHTEALQSYQRAASLKPDYPEAHRAVGEVLGILGRCAEAIDSLERAIALNPHDVKAHWTCGDYLRRLGRCDGALESFRRVLMLDPGNTTARFNVALLALLRGELREGWPLYEARFELDKSSGFADRWPRPRWTGREDLAGRSIVLWAERGIGDTLQFSRYVPRVRALDARVTLQVQPPIKRFMQGQFPGVTVIGAGDIAEVPDFHCPLMSLPGAFRTTLTSIPADMPYLQADSGAAARWRERLPRRAPLMVGIAWQGNPDAEKNWARGRSIPLHEFEVLARLPRVQLVSLQTGFGTDQLASAAFRDQVLVPGDNFDAGPDGFIDTAAVIRSLDLVICCDSAVAHLAGALGAPVWLALHFTAEWRWLLDRSDSPWYPTLRLFRQRHPGEWAGVFREIAASLNNFAPDAADARGRGDARG